MAALERDVAQWLDNKLGTADDQWSGHSIRSQLSAEKLNRIQDCFDGLSTHVKVKLLLSFLHLPKRNIDDWRGLLEGIIEQGLQDADTWVGTVAKIVQNFPSTGQLHSDPQDSEKFSAIKEHLKKIGRKANDPTVLPLECAYLSKPALNTTVGTVGAPVKHFSLKRKPKSATLKAELLMKSNEAINNAKRGHHRSSVPVKIRSFAKELEDPTVFGGSKVPSARNGPSAGFLKSNTLSSRPQLNSKAGHHNKKESSIKLLDMDEMPAVGREAKRRKRELEAERIKKERALAAGAKEAAAASATPDYAAGLMSQAPKIVPVGHLAPVAVNNNMDYAAAASSASRVPINSSLPISSDPTIPSSASGQLLQPGQGHSIYGLPQGQLPLLSSGLPVSQRTLVPGSSAPIQFTAAGAGQAQHVTVHPLTPGVQGVPPNFTANNSIPAAAAPKKGLSLTKEQMFQAQEMFKTSNKVTRPEKALILGFMAGSRDNPCPDRGDIVNIKLSETNETRVVNGQKVTELYDVFFQMNYSTGQWKRLRKARDARSQIANQSQVQ